MCSRREKREQHRATRREDTHQTPSGIRNGHGQRYSQDSWRGRTDIVSFYFTRFLEKATEKDLWKHFKKFGDVREVFIPKNRNKTGRRYGFVRFKGVEEGCRGCKKSRRSYHSLKIGSGTGHL